MNRLVNKFNWLYPRVVIGSSIAGGIINDIYYSEYINKKNKDYCFNMLDITADGMLGGFVFGLISPVAIPYLAITTLFDAITDKDNEPA
jgi:hypothetical protein